MSVIGQPVPRSALRLVSTGFPRTPHGARDHEGDQENDRQWKTDIWDHHDDRPEASAEIIGPHALRRANHDRDEGANGEHDEREEHIRKDPFEAADVVLLRIGHSSQGIGIGLPSPTARKVPGIGLTL
jgi:hypothetical protein